MTARPPLVLVPQYFGSTVFDRRTSRYVPFDHETTDVLLRSCVTPIGALVDAAPPGHADALVSIFSNSRRSTSSSRFTNLKPGFRKRNTLAQARRGSL